LKKEYIFIPSQLIVLYQNFLDYKIFIIQKYSNLFFDQLSFLIIPLQMSDI